MKIKKILIVPESERILKPKTYNQKSKINLLKHYRNIINSLNKPEIKYNAEIMFYGDMPLILGKENVFVVGEYKDQYLSPANRDCFYPSCHNTPEPTFLKNFNEIYNISNSLDAILISSRANKHREKLSSIAKSNNIPIAIIDRYDHESLYNTSKIDFEKSRPSVVDVKEKNLGICRNFKYGLDFDIYFKHTLPIKFNQNFIFPLCPAPIRPESYNYPDTDKNIDIFFIGRPMDRIAQPDRRQIVELMIDNFDNSKIKFVESQSSFMSPSKYQYHQSKSLIILSPSGRVWNGSRLGEAGLSKSVLIAPKPYHRTVEPKLNDKKNALLYDVEFKDGGYHLINSNEFVEKVKYYLDNPSELSIIAKNWNNDVLNGHTTYARAKYILNTMETFFS